MAAEVKQCLHHLQVTLVDCDVQRRLSAFVSGVEVSAASVQDLDDGAFITKRGVMHGPVSVLILKETIHLNFTNRLDNLLIACTLLSSYITHNAALNTNRIL